MARGVGVGLAALGQGRLAGELDAVLVVDGDHLDQHRVADPADVVDAADVAVGQLADVDQAVLAGQDLDERAEVLDRGDAAFVDLADLDPFGHRLDLVAGGLGPGGVDAARRDDAVVLDVDLGAGLFLEARIVLPPGPMSRPIFSGLIWIWISRGALARDLLARPLDRPEHGPQDLEPGLAGLVERLADDLLGDALDLEVELDAGDAALRCRRP